MSIKLNLKGWEEQIKAIEKAGASVNEVCSTVIREDAQIMNDELKNKMQSASVPSNLIESMDAPEVQTEGNRFTATVGYKKGAYNSKNPSNAYKVIYLNYGTPMRTTKSGANRGKVVGRGFVQKAKNSGKTKINRANKEAFNKIIEGLKK